ncbi:endospore germination permease [Evansella sp. AB-P1]|uniref:GerAB/ArcD/ProY family transporter n=1 Tax=Evansella sp. AB-P1 TaxID=3037653 RepID=UPI00241E1CD0|nr:endospore germination permease [Evansella sp. AB-P1]MDG5788454.1 endospore germination permease [Evansella sp. AB-P1]
MILEKNENKFGNWELFVFTYSSTIVLGLIFLPYISDAEIRSAWLKVMIGVVPYILFLYLLFKVIKKFNQRDIFKTFDHLSTNWVYYPIMFYLFVSTLYSIFWGIKSLAIVIQTYLLQNTEQWIVMTVFFIVLWVSALYGITAITRVVVLMFICDIVVVITVVILIFSEEFKWINIPPVFTVDIFTFMKSSLSEMTRYGGIIALLSFLPLLKKDTNIFKSTSSALLLVMVMYTLVSLITLGTFGYEQTLTLLSPLTALIQTTYADVALFERLDLFFLTIWIWALYKAAMIYVWFAADLFQRVIPLNEKKEWIPITVIVGIISVITMITPSFVNLKWEPYNINMVIYTLALPIVLFVYMLLRKKQDFSEN